MTTFKKTVTDRYECPVCKTSMNNFPSTINIHNATKSHIKKAGIEVSGEVVAKLDIKAKKAAENNAKVNKKIADKRNELNDELIDLLIKNKEDISVDMIKYVLLKLHLSTHDYPELIDAPKEALRPLTPATDDTQEINVVEITDRELMEMFEDLELEILHPHQSQSEAGYGAQRPTS